MQKTCVNCGSNFEITEEDIKTYEDISPTFEGTKYPIPPPTDCPDCRHQCRCAFRNERVLYNRTCDLCKKPMVTVCSGERSFPIYCQDCWWGDGWDSEEYARDFDFDQPFFEQFQDLMDNCPRLSLNNTKHENSGYCNQCVCNKNSYLLWGSDENQDSMYGYWIQRCFDTFNSSNTADSTLCADVVDCEKCYKCIYCQDLVNCSDCAFCFDLIGCQNCFKCAGLRNKQYYIENKSHSKEEYEAKLKEFNLGSFSQYEKLKQKFPDVHCKVPHKYVHTINSENCTGDYISNSKDCHRCYDAFDCEKCRYAYNLVHQHYNNVDVSYVTETRNVFQVMSAVGEHLYFSTQTWYSSNAWYCDQVKSSHNMFGCCGIKQKKHCILNKQYSEEEYKSMIPKIIEHMQKTPLRSSVASEGQAGEWGHFFTSSLSPFAYNETVAQDYYPLTKEQATKLGYRWQENIDEPPQAEKVIPAEKLPDSIDDIPDDVLNWAIVCDVTNRPFKIMRKELEFYRQVRLPIPRLHPDERQMRRMAMRNPRKLWGRTCDKCGKEFQTTYAPERPETVFCEECYLNEVY